MSKVDPKDNVRFLIACINHSTNGKPNFGLVAEELEIVSKGAAAKRYERLLKSLNASPTKPAATDATDEAADSSPTKPKKRKAPAAKPVTVKKAKPSPRGKKAKAKADEDESEDESPKSESESSLSEPPEDVKMDTEDAEI